MTNLTVPPGSIFNVPPTDLQLSNHPVYRAVPAILATGLEIYLGSEYLDPPGNYRCKGVKVETEEPNVVRLYFEGIRDRDWFVFYAQEYVFTPEEQ